MPSPIEISVSQLSRIIGLPGAPLLIDVRQPEEIAADRRLIPTARHLCSQLVPNWAGSFSGERTIVYCHDGGDMSRGAAAWLRQAGGDAQTLEGDSRLGARRISLLFASTICPRAIRRVGPRG